jgi:nucleotide-binding universal stress UspA family protein
MIKSILVPVDGSPHAQKAIELATDLAAKYGAKITFVHAAVEQTAPDEYAQLALIEHVGTTSRDTLEFVWQRLVKDAEGYAREHGLKDVEGAILEGDPAGAIVAYAKEKNVDMIVMGSRGMGDIKGLLLGSVSHKVASLAPCTCITVK